MDFPAFHLDLIGNRTLIAVIAIVHVTISHALAVGAMPLITLMEWWGHRTGNADWDRLAYRLLAVCFIITTSLGAMTGVGIWFSTALVSPMAIGSLIRIFFWAWFSEWIVFTLEVSLILTFFLTWKHWRGPRKRRHIRLGMALSVCSWLTMVIITAILGFMMDPGLWLNRPSFLHGTLNPIYLPQLLFRTPLAMTGAGIFSLLLVYFFTNRASPFRSQAVRFVSLWTLAWAGLCLAGAWYYWVSIPEAMVGNLPVALGTQAFEAWHRTVAWLIAAATATVLVIATWGVLKPMWLPRAVSIVPMLLLLALLGYFERVREFIRKPDVIAHYMYGNGLRRADAPLLQVEGLLAHAAYTPTRTITAENRDQAGETVFSISCTRCHTTTGVNGIVAKLTGLYGPPPWEAESVKGYIRTMHHARPFMPPFLGTEDELDAMTGYLMALREDSRPLAGAQSVGVVVPE